MFHHSMKILLLPVILLAFLLTGAQAGEYVAPGGLPDPVKASLREHFPQHVVLSAEMKKRDRRPYYEVHLRHRGTIYEVDIAPRGQILEVDRED
jgi:hypothetical protein